MAKVLSTVSEVEQGGTAAEREVWALKGEVQELRREVARYKSIEAARKASYWADDLIGLYNGRRVSD